VEKICTAENAEHAEGIGIVISSCPERSRRIVATCDVVSRSETMHRIRRRNLFS